MKKTYEIPVATEELFAANSYIAACAWQITSTSGNNRMQCANPSHRHFMDGTYFTSVWVEATNSTCQIKVDRSGIGKTEILNNNNAQPAKSAVVYGETGTQYYCNATWGGYNVPSFVSTYGGWGNKKPTTNNPCYGTYVNEGDYDSIMEKVFS
ncbi:hypothetical protein [Thomasclavelia sp.]|uniref:hypothetical protein n=1 Tax=Thomasclavelia sp. TaxID=3025757 RepID=UPI0025DC9FAE|nr:hypothetical protein [Thomasclavelia sp.]